MQLKNKTQREEFLKNYRAWELIDAVPELELKFYRYVLPNKTTIIATEYACLEFDDYRRGKFEYKKSTGVKYHLILSKTDTFNTGYSDTAFKFYNPSGDNKSSIINYLTTTKPEVKL